MFKGQHFFETIGERRNPNKCDISTDRSSNNDFLADSSNGGKLLSIMPIVSNIFPSLDIEKGYITCIC